MPRVTGVRRDRRLNGKGSKGQGPNGQCKASINPAAAASLCAANWQREKGLRGDIEKHFPDSITTETPDADYLYRASIPRQEVATAIARIATGIDYSNFKNSVKDHRRAKFYAEVWAAMYKMQDELEGVTNPLFRPLKGKSRLFKGE